MKTAHVSLENHCTIAFGVSNWCIFTFRNFSLQAISSTFRKKKRYQNTTSRFSSLTSSMKQWAILMTDVFGTVTSSCGNQGLLLCVGAMAKIWVLLNVEVCSVMQVEEVFLTSQDYVPTNYKNNRSLIRYFFNLLFSESTEYLKKL